MDVKANIQPFTLAIMVQEFIISLLSFANIRIIV